MDAATTSPYWSSYRASKTYRLTIHFFEAQLQVPETSNVNGAMLDPYVVVFLTRDRGEHGASLAIHASQNAPNLSNAPRTMSSRRPSSRGIEAEDVCAEKEPPAGVEPVAGI